MRKLGYAARVSRPQMARRSPFNRALRVGRGVRLLVAGLLTLLAVRAAGAEPRLVVVAPPELAAVAEEVRRLGEGDISALLVATGVTVVAPPIRVLLFAEDTELARQTPPWVSGLAAGRDSTVALFPARVRAYPETDLRSLLHHELAHVLVARASRGRPVPRWFDEGVATVAARQWGLEDRARFALAVLDRGPASTADLDRGFLGARDDCIHSYALSAALVRYLVRRFGPDAAARILDAIGDGRSFEDAFFRVTGSSLAGVERDFFRRELIWSTWIPFLTSSTALWMGITLLVLYAIRRRRLRSASLRARWDQEDEDLTVN
jgi:hypothetical protein